MTGVKQPLVITSAGGPIYRARHLLDLAKITADISTDDGLALWHACDGLQALLRNHMALGEPIEAVAARVAETLGVRE